MSTKQSKKLTFMEKFCYGLGDCSANIVVALTGTFLSAYYTDTVGIAAAAVGTMLLVCRVFDGGSDLLMGALVDRTNSKYGKARPWMLWTAPLMAIGIYLLFNCPAGLSDKGNLVYAYLTYIFMMVIVYTANNLPFNALLSRMTLDVQDRASAAAMRFVMTQITTIITNAITAKLLASVGWRTLSIIYAIVAMILSLLCFAGVKEHVGEDESGSVVIKKVPFKEAFPALIKNKYFYIQALLFMFVYIAYCCPLQTQFYYANIILNNVEAITLMTLANSLPTLAVNLVVPSMVKKLGKQKILIIGSICMIIGSIVVGIAGSAFALAMVGLCIRGAGIGFIFSSLFAATADVVDYGEWKFGIRSEGLVNSCTSFGMKLGIGFGLAMGSWIIAFGGYDGTAAVQTEAAVNAIKFAFGYSAAIVSVIVLILCIMMNLDKYLPQIQHDLEAKAAAEREG